MNAFGASVPLAPSSVRSLAMAYSCALPSLARIGALMRMVNFGPTAWRAWALVVMLQLTLKTPSSSSSEDLRTSPSPDAPRPFQRLFFTTSPAHRFLVAMIPSTRNSDPEGSSSRLLLEALRMIRSRQARRGDPQPASASTMEAVWVGRWDPAKRHDDGAGVDADVRRARGLDPRCAVCLDEIKSLGTKTGADRGELGGISLAVVPAESLELSADIGTCEARESANESGRASGRSAYLPCGHRFHIHW